jgi:hypothetical protein
MTDDTNVVPEDLKDDLQAMKDNCQGMAEYLEEQAAAYPGIDFSASIAALLAAESQLDEQLESFDDCSDGLNAAIYQAVSALIEKHTGRKRAFVIRVDLLPDPIH